MYETRRKIIEIKPQENCWVQKEPGCSRDLKSRRVVNDALKLLKKWNKSEFCQKEQLNQLKNVVWNPKRIEIVTHFVYGGFLAGRNLKNLLQPQLKH